MLTQTLQLRIQLHITESNFLIARRKLSIMVSISFTTVFPVALVLIIKTFKVRQGVDAMALIQNNRTLMLGKMSEIQESETQKYLIVEKGDGKNSLIQLIVDLKNQDNNNKSPSIIY